MNSLEQTVCLKIQDIVEKLHNLDCTLLGNKDDAWIMELLFKPGFHRYHLIEWILSKLGCDIGKMSGPQNSAEERMKNLQSTVSDLGICRQNSKDIIEGTATLKEQLEFWCTLVNIIWLKYEITSKLSMGESDEGVSLSLEKTKRKCFSEEFDEACYCVSKICESVNMKHLFRGDLQLLAPDVEREIKNLSTSNSEKYKIPSLQKFKERTKDMNSFAGPNEVYRNLCLNKVAFNENEEDGVSEIELNKLEEELHNVSIDFKNSAESIFNDVYNDLKPLISHTKADEFTDVGPAFKKVEPLLEDLLQLKKSFPKLESSNSKLLKINSDLEDLISQGTFDDSNYVNILRLLKDEN